VEAGCRLLVDRFAEFASREDGAQLKLDIANHLLDRLALAAKRVDVEIGELAATFLAVALFVEQFLIVHVGDGVVGIVVDGRGRVASGPDNAEFANQTTFLTSESAAPTMRLLRGSLEGVAGFILMSDGTAHSLYNARTKELAPACIKLVAGLGAAPATQAKYPEHEKQLRRLIDTKIRLATKDDCSLGLLSRAVR
jgi:hypothetical protein